jgi:FAD/FMN-containing dehydrogenase
MLTRRELLKAVPGLGAAAMLGGPGACAWLPGEPSQAATVNDIHSQLNPTRVRRIVRADSVQSIQRTIRQARSDGSAISIAGGMHAMGGQQFGSDTILLDTRAMNRVQSFDPARGLVEVEAGIQWPELVAYLIETQQRERQQWGIIQKQTGADRLCIGGALAANVHGRGVHLKPIIGDVESFVLIDAEGSVRRCSRKENVELFRLAIGGYGLFGVIASVTLRLGPRRKVQRVVEVLDLEDLIPNFEERIADGTLYGDFQYSTDMTSRDFLRKGIFSRYRPVDDKIPVLSGQKELAADGWKKLVYLAHVDKRAAFDYYSAYYRSTSGQVYWSDTHQLSVYLDDYHLELDRQLGANEKSTEMITEIYFPRKEVHPFLEDVRKDLRESKANVIFGTFRLIEQDDESFLAWAKEPYGCVIFNLHTAHNKQALDKTAADFRRLIDRAIQHGGSYYLTYHRWATRKQVEICYPQFSEFLRLKKKYDPEERFQSDWYRHYKAMFADKL